MSKTSLKNKLILSFMCLLLVIVLVVGLVNRLAHDFYLAMAISTAFAMAAGVIFGSMFSRSLVTRLNNLSEEAKIISGGDLTREIAIVSQDEVRDLEEVFAAMLVDLRAMIAEMKRASARIQDTNKSLVDLVKKVVTSSGEIDEAAQDIAKGSEEQTKIAQKTTISLERSIREMEEIVRRSALTTTAIDDARHQTELGEASARETLKHLEGVLKQMVAHAMPVSRLASKVEKIRIVTQLIDEIAQKTDLLSLNASIEATRAGESGKGFALVANEIRGMAENSKQSSQEIGAIVEDILKDNKAVIGALKKSQISIHRGRQIIRGIVNTFGDMLSGVKNISGGVHDMKNATDEQMKQIKALLDHFQQLSELAHRNFVSTQKTTVATKDQKKDTKEILDAVQSLTSLSDKMLETQKRFKLRES